MSCQHETADLLPFYASGALSAGERRAVETHLAGCAECRATLALWREVGESVHAEAAGIPAPSSAVLGNVLEAVRQPQPNPFAAAYQLVAAQISLLRREIWLASALVMAVGYVLAVTVAPDQSGTRFLEAIAPLLAAAGVALIYGPESDPALEIALATPTSPRQILLARLFLVFGYDLLLCLLASVGLVLALPGELLTTIIWSWLGPMTFLSALALVLSLVIGTGGAMMVAVFLWWARWLTGGMVSGKVVVADHWLSQIWLAQTYSAGWENSGLLLVLAAILVAVAVALVDRRENYLRGEVGLG